VHQGTGPLASVERGKGGCESRATRLRKMSKERRGESRSREAQSLVEKCRLIIPASSSVSSFHSREAALGPEEGPVDARREPRRKGPRPSRPRGRGEPSQSRSDCDG
jgi:hypothetical protein